MSGEAIDAFQLALAERGILPGSLRADGELHRCGTVRKPRSRNGVYCLHLDGGIPAGWLQNHEDGLGVTKWRAEQTAPMTEAERLAWRRQVEAQRVKRDADKAEHRAAAARKANAMWARMAELRRDHPYLVRKRIEPHGLREHRGLAVVPLFDADGEIVNLQFIAGDGRKNFLEHGRKQGCFHVIREPGIDDDVICIGEGFATMAAVFEKTGRMSVVAFDCGNLKDVAVTWRSKVPGARIVICADDDEAGRDGARKAAEAIGNAAIALPPRSRAA